MSGPDQLSTHASRERALVTLDQLAQSLGTTIGISDWVRIDQDMIDRFAGVTGDDAFIHVDPERAAATRFHGTIAHGLLTLSLLPRLLRAATPQLGGTRMSVNYGFDRVRFITPVPVNSRVRGQFDLSDISAPKAGFRRITYDVRVELEHASSPAVTARWLLGHWMK
jgi:acyl dehydratase